MGYSGGDDKADTVAVVPGQAAGYFQFEDGGQHR